MQGPGRVANGSSYLSTASQTLTSAEMTLATLDTSSSGHYKNDSFSSDDSVCRRSSRLSKANTSFATNQYILADADVQANTVPIPRMRPTNYRRPSKRKKSPDRSQLLCTRPLCTYLKPFSGKWELQRHRKSVHAEGKIRYVCMDCGRAGFRKDRVVGLCKEKHHEKEKRRDWSDQRVKSQRRDGTGRFPSSLI